MAGEFNQILVRDPSGAVITYNSAWTTSQYYELGQKICDANGNEYTYCKSASNVAFTQYDVVVILTAGAQAVTTSLATDNGIKCGIAPVAVAAVASTVKYGFLLTCTGAHQVTSMRVAAACADGISLQTTATAGVVDDATGQVYIAGLGIGTDQGSAAGANATAVVNNPYVEIGWA